MAVVSDDTLPFEASGGSVAVVSGDKPTATLSVKTDDNYMVRLAALNVPDSTRTFTMSLDGGAVKAVTLGADGSRAEGTTFARLRPGQHTLTLDIPGGGRAYLDYVRLEPSRKEPNVVEAELLLEKLGGHEKSDAVLVDARPQYSGGSALRWQPAQSNELMALPITVEKEGDYTVEMAVDADETTPAWTLQIDKNAPQTVTLPDGAKGMQRLRFTNILHIKPGQHNLVVTGNGVKPALTLDWLRVVKTRYANALEAEGLKVVENKNGSVDTQDMKGFGVDWSGDAQLWFHAEKVGAEVTLELPVAANGAYNLVVYYTTAKDYGIVQTLVDGKPVGDPTDCFTPDVKAKGRVPLGALDLTAGTHRITFHVTGKNAASSSYLIGVDAIGLEPVK